MTAQTLEGRVALVTGSTTGIGFGSAKRLIEHGATVYITGRRQEVLETAVAKLGEGAHGIQADASVKADMQRVADTIKAAHGKLDILFANAGGGHATALEELTEEQIDSELSINIKGVVLTMQAMLDVLRDGASVVLNASITADIGFAGLCGVCGDQGSGALTRSQLDDGPQAPRHPREHHQPRRGADGGVRQGTKDDRPAGGRLCGARLERNSRWRVGSTQDIGDALVFLASDASAYIRGIDLVVDGGMTRVYAGKN
jgi:NAD(P)-dependent dehydrogenase (short-subunit alcohol dehydrogenase family)